MDNSSLNSQKMKLVCQFLLVLCVMVNVFFIKTAVGSYSYSLLSIGGRAGSKGQPEPHRLHKRQAGIEQCSAIVLEEECNGGLLQEEANLLLRCNLAQSAEFVSFICQRNSRGDYCSLVGIGLSDMDVCASFNGTCTLQCKDQLVFIRDQLGCCISAYNDSTSPFYTPIFNYTLWSSCGVEPVTQECAPSPINLVNSQVDPTCTTSVLLERIGFISCTRRFVQPILDRLSATGGCQLFNQSILEECGVDALGKPCYSQTLELGSLFVTANISCGSTSTCDPPCIRALETFNSTSGCCINSFNGSLAGVTFAGVTIPSYDWLSYQFWSQCGLNTPGSCELRLNGAAFLKAPGIITAFAAVMMSLMVL